MSRDLKREFEVVARSLRGSYPDVTADLIAEYHALWMRGESAPGIIWRFAEDTFESATNIFGEPDV